MHRSGINRLANLTYCLGIFLLSVRGLAQTPSVILVSRFEGVEQISANQSIPAESLFGAGVTFEGSTPSGVRAFVRQANGADREIPRDESNDLFLELSYPDVDALNAEFPAGPQRVQVGSNVYTFNLAPLPTAGNPLRVGNFDALQAWSESDIQVEFSPRSPTDEFSLLRFSIEDAVGNELRSTPELGEPGALNGSEGVAQVSSLPNGEYKGRLIWSPFIVEPASGGLTAVVHASASMVTFPIIVDRPTPIITRSPEPVEALAGRLITLTVETAGPGDSYRWYYQADLDSAPELVFTGGDTLTIDAKAGYYFVRVLNANGETESSKAQVTVIPRPGVRTFLKNLPEHFPAEEPTIENLATGLTSDATGGFWFANVYRIQHVSDDRIIRTIAGGEEIGMQDGWGANARFGGTTGAAIGDLAWDGNEFLYAIDPSGHTIRRISLLGEVTTIAGEPGTIGPMDGTGRNARFQWPRSIAFDYHRNQLVVGDSFNSVLRWVSPAGVTTTILGDRETGVLGADGAGGDVLFSDYVLNGLCVSREGDYLIFEEGRLRSIDPDGGSVTTLVSAPAGSTLANDRFVHVFEYPGGGLYLLSRSGIYQISRDQLPAEPSLSWHEFSTRNGIWGQAGFSVSQPTLAPNGRFYGFSASGFNLTEMELPTYLRSLDPPDASIGAARLLNLSVRTRIEPGRHLIAGFVNQIGSTRPMVLRGVGPTLSDFGVSNSLPRPQLTLRQGSEELARNVGWTSDDGGSFGGFPLPPGSSDAVISANLSAGAYTVELAPADNDGGVALMEVYTSPDALLEATPINLSARGWVINGEPLIAGFVLSGTNSRLILIRGIGPTLSDFGVTTALSNPTLRLYRGNEVIRVNDDWNDPFRDGLDTITPTFERAGAFSLETDSKDAAIVIELPPGAYTVHLNNTPPEEIGEALIEIYLLN